MIAWFSHLLRGAHLKWCFIFTYNNYVNNTNSNVESNATCTNINFDSNINREHISNTKVSSQEFDSLDFRA